VSSTQEFNNTLANSNGTTLEAQFPAQTNLLLCDKPLADDLQADLEKVAVGAGRSLICIDLGVLALQTAKLLDNEERQRIVGVGTSGIEFAKRINPAAPSIPVQTIAFSRQRASRQLSVGAQIFASEPILTDDVVVSGRTLEAVNSAMTPPATVAVTGLLLRSKRTRQLAGVADLRAAVSYAKDGGGNPNINSVETLMAIPERLDELAERCFGDLAPSFKELLRRSMQ
jgi:hypothetical protein